MTAPLVSAEPALVESLRLKLSDDGAGLPEKYRVLFSLRNVAGPAAQEALELGARAPRPAPPANADARPPVATSPPPLPRHCTAAAAACRRSAAAATHCAGS
jgi:hypothetical protein